MTPEPALLAHIACAEDSIRQARASWDAVSASAAETCAGHLNQAIAEMAAAGREAITGRSVPGVGSRLERLRGDLDSLSRLVDAALAFNRGLALRAAPEPWTAPELTGERHV